MISLYTGTPGSGKSLHTACKIYYALKFKRPVVANFELADKSIKNSDLYNYWDNDKLDPVSLMKFSRSYFGNNRVIEGQILLIIDECQLLFNCRGWNEKGRDMWVKFFSQHRKFGFNIILVTQFDKMLDKQIRSMVEYQFIHRKVSNFGAKGKLLSIWTGNRLYVAVQFWYGNSERVGSEFFLYHKKYAKLYDSYLIFDEAMKVEYREPELMDVENG